MIKNITTVKQSRELEEAGLGWETADHEWKHTGPFDAVPNYELSGKSYYRAEPDLPAWSLGQLLEIIKEKAGRFEIVIGEKEVYLKTKYRRTYAPSLFDAAYSTVLFLLHLNDPIPKDLGYLIYDLLEKNYQEIAGEWNAEDLDCIAGFFRSLEDVLIPDEKEERVHAIADQEVFNWGSWQFYSHASSVVVIITSWPWILEKHFLEIAKKNAKKRGEDWEDEDSDDEEG
jgi:hypothetical protein